MQAEKSVDGTMMQHGLMVGLGPGMDARVVFDRAVTPEAKETSPDEEESRPEEEQSPGGEEQEPGEEEQNPATPIGPIDLDEIDKFANALLYIQSIGHGSHEENESMEQWPDRVLHLHEHCIRHADGLRALGEKVAEIVQTSPGEWIKNQGRLKHLQKNIITPMWKEALTCAFMSRDVYVQMAWFYSLNYYAVQAKLLCKFVIKGFKGPETCLVYQAQGRVSNTKYRVVTSKKRKLDDELKAECTGSNSK